MQVRNEPVKLLRIAPDERVRCTYCTRKALKRAVLFRKFDSRGVLEELIVFCGHGCAMVYAMKPNKNRGEVV